MRECSSCQTANDEKAQFCLECGQKLTPMGRQGAPADGDQNAQPTGSGGRPRLHSPILGGYEEIDDSPRRAPDKSRGSAPKSKPGAHLRSPLLGGGGDDDEEFDDPTAKPIKNKAQQGRPGGGKMRSPLLGGSGGGDPQGDYEEDFPLRDRNDDRSGGSAFPHRNRPHAADPNTPSAPQQQGGKAHLRSPLLGGDDDYVDDPVPVQPGNRNAGGNPRPVKLHSPIFDRSSSNSFDDYDDDDGEDIDDPNVLRSPLLAAKSRMPADRPPKQQQPQPQLQQQQQPQYNQAPPAQVSQPGFGSQQPQPGYAPANQQPGFAPPSQMSPPLPQPGYAPPAPPQPAFISPPINAPQPGFAPPIIQAPSQNAFQANPTNSTNPAQALSSPEPITNPLANQYEYGAPGSGMGGSPAGTPSFSAPAAASGARPLPPAFPDAQPSNSSFSPAGSGTIGGGGVQQSMPGFPTAASELSPGLSPDLKSALGNPGFPEPVLPTEELAAPLPKLKSKPNRFNQPAPLPLLEDDDADLQPVGGRSKGLPLSVQDSSSNKRRFEAASDSHRSQSSGLEPSGPMMIVCVTAFLGAASKLWYIFTYLGTFMKPESMPMLADQLGQLAVFVGLIIFAMLSAQKGSR